jgi:hypothetical protein
LATTERHAVERPEFADTRLPVAVPSSVPDEAGLGNLETVERISVRRAVTQVLRESGCSAASPGILRGASGVAYEFDIVAMVDHETWVFDISTDEAQSESDSVLSLFGKITDVKPKKATLLAIPGTSPQMRRLAQLYNIQVLAGSSPAQLCDVVRLTIKSISQTHD